MSAERAFYAAPTPYILMWRSIVFVLGTLIVAATVIGQWRIGRFPAYRDLAIACALPFVAYGVLALLTYAVCWFFPVRLSAHGLKSTNLFGVPAFVQWPLIRTAHFREVQGVPYIFIEAQGRAQPITVPVWLREPERFAQAVNEWAGPQNPLTLLLSDTEG